LFGKKKGGGGRVASTVEEGQDMSKGKEIRFTQGSSWYVRKYGLQNREVRPGRGTNNKERGRAGGLRQAIDGEGQAKKTLI